MGRGIMTTAREHYNNDSASFKTVLNNAGETKETLEPQLLGVTQSKFDTWDAEMQDNNRFICEALEITPVWL